MLGFIRKFSKKRVIVSGLAIVLAVVLTLSGVQITRRIETGNLQLGSVTIGIGKPTITIGMAGVCAAGTADYTCDGIQDYVQFNTAIAALPAGGGEIIVLGGTYVWTDILTTVNVPANVTIEGVGMATSFTGDGATSIFTATGNNTTFCNLRTDLGGISMGATTGWEQRNVLSGATYYAYRNIAGASVFNNATVASLTDSGLTSGRVPIAGAGGLLGDSSNLTWANPSLNVGGGNVTRTATYVVAASNAPAHVKAQADYVCDGIADNVEIQAAYDIIPVTGGLVQLSGGTFTIATPIRADENYKGIVGEGKGTILRAGVALNNSLIWQGYSTTTGQVFRNFRLDGQKATQTGGQPTLDLSTANYAFLENIEAYDADSVGLWIRGEHVVGLNLVAHGCVSSGFQFQNMTYSWIEGETYDNGQYGFFDYKTYSNTYIIKTHGNHADGGWVSYSTNNTYDLMSCSNNKTGLQIADGGGYSIIKGIYTGNTGSGIDTGTDGGGHNTLLGVECSYNGVSPARPERFGIVSAGVGGHDTMMGVRCFANGDSGIFTNGPGNIIVGGEFYNNGVDPVDAVNRVSGIMLSDWAANGFDNIIQSSIFYDNWDTSITSNLTTSANATQKVVSVISGTLFKVGQPVTISDSTPLTESNCIESISSNNLTMRNNLTNTYTTAQNARVTVRVSQTKGVNESEAGGGHTFGYLLMNNNNLRNQPGTKVTLIGTNAIVRDNLGYITENSGAATMLINTGAIVVAHGLSTNATRVQVTMTSNPGLAVSTWTSAYGSNNFTINTSTNVTTATTFDWRAVVGEGN